MAFQIAYIFEAIDKFSKVAQRLENHVDKINKKVGATTESLGKFHAKASRSFDDISAKVPRAANHVEEFNRKTKRSGILMNFMAGTVNNLKFRLASLMVTMGLVGGFGLKGIVQTGKEIENAFLNLSALTGIVGKDLEFLNQQAHILSRTFGVDVAEVFVAMKRIAGLKPELIGNVEGLTKMTRAALLLDAPIGQLEKTSRTLAVALNIYGKGAEKAAEFSNILASSARLGSAEVNEVGLAFLKSASIMQLSNITFKDGIALIQTLARSGLLRQAAGVGLNTVLVRLQRAGFDLEKQDIGDVFQEIGKRLDGMTDSTRRAEEVYKLFGLRQIKTGLPLIKNLLLFKKFREEIGKSNIAFDTANTVMKGYEKQSTAIMSIFDERLKVIFDGIKPELLDIKKQFLIFFEVLNTSLPGGIKGTLGFLLWSFARLLELLRTIAVLLRILASPIIAAITGSPAAFADIPKLLDKIKAIEETPIKLEQFFKPGELGAAGAQKLSLDINLRGNTEAVSGVQAEGTQDVDLNFDLGDNLAFIG